MSKIEATIIYSPVLHINFLFKMKPWKAENHRLRPLWAELVHVETAALPSRHPAGESPVHAGRPAGESPVHAGQPDTKP